MPIQTKAILAVLAILLIISGSIAQRVSECDADDKDCLKLEKQVAKTELIEIKSELETMRFADDSNCNREGANQL